MDRALLVTLGAAAALLLAVLCALLTLVLADRRRTRGELASARADLAAMQHRLDALTPRTTAPAVPSAEYLITSVGVPQPEPAAAPMTSRQFASAALGESLVKVFSFGYGVRRALSAENRNRIGFEIRREVRRSRKRRRRDLKEARRNLRAAERAGLAEDAA